MKIIVSHFLCFLITTLNIILAQSLNIKWQKALGGTDEDKGYSECILPDGNIVIAGGTFSNNGNVIGNHTGFGVSEDFWIAKIDTGGNLIWQRCFGGNSIDIANSIKATLDGGFIVAGSASSMDGDVIGLHGTLFYSDYWIIKLDSMGYLEWQKCYGGSSYDIANDIELTSDSGYIIAGLSESWDGDVSFSHSPGDGEAWVVKIDHNGNLQWQKSLGGTNWDYGQSIKPLSDGGYAVGILTASNDGDITCSHGISDYLLIKLDASGNIQWSQCYGGSGSDALFSLDITKDNGFILAGYVNSNDGDVSGLNGPSDIWVVKTDSLGTIQWSRCYGGSNFEECFAIRTTSDSGAVLTGTSYSGDSSAFCHNGLYADLWAIKVDKLGNIEWTNCMGGMMEETGRDIIETNTLEYVVLGYTKSNDGDVSGNHGGTCVSDSCPDFWLIKIAALGTNVLESKSILNFSYYLNPGTYDLNLQITSSVNEEAQLQILDYTGRIILNQSSLHILIGSNKYQRNIGTLNSSVYFLQLVTPEKILTKKLVIE